MRILRRLGGGTVTILREIGYLLMILVRELVKYWDTKGMRIAIGESLWTDGVLRVGGTMLLS